jgi:signal recognition particle subunit SRP54
MAQQKFDQEEMQKQEERLKSGEFTLDDFKAQLKQITQPGLMQKMMGMMPGMGQLKEAMNQVDAEGDMKRLLGIIDSMTLDERRNPSKVIDQSRRRRIAAGSGVEPHEVNDLVKQFDGMKGMMEQMAGKGVRERMRMAQQMQREAMANPGGKLGKSKKSTGKRLTPQQKKKLKKERERELRRRKRQGSSADSGSGD